MVKRARRQPATNQYASKTMVMKRKYAALVECTGPLSHMVGQASRPVIWLADRPPSNGKLVRRHLVSRTCEPAPECGRTNLAVRSEEHTSELQSLRHIV